MKKITKLLFAGVLAFAVAPAVVLSLASMKEPQVVRAYSGGLTNFQEVNGVLSWDAFPGAADYGFNFGNAGGLTDGATTFNLEDEAKAFHFETGTYDYSVYAVDDDGNQISDASSGSYTYTSTQTRLDTPTNLSWDHTIMSWDAVEFAQYYSVSYYEYDSVHSEFSYIRSDNVFGTSQEASIGLKVNTGYRFTVTANPSFADLEHMASLEATSPVVNFTSVVENLDEHVSISNGQLEIVNVPNIHKASIEVFDSSTSSPLGGGVYTSFPIDLYDLFSNLSITDGTYNIEIEVFNEYKEPLAPVYTYENWEYDSSLAPQHLSGNVSISGTLKVGETVTANVTDTNNTGTLSYFWYRSDPSEGWVSVQAGTNNTLLVPEICANKRLKVIVASSVETGYLESSETDIISPADTPNVLSGTVTIDGSLKYGEILTANVTGSNNTGVLSYQWKRYAADIDGANSQTYTITEEDIGKTLKCVVTSSVETGSIQSDATAEIAKADGPVAPSGITATACTTTDNNDGTINGVTTAMEYKLSSAADWTSGTGETLTGLDAGTYYVRVKETATHNAGENAIVVVNGYNAPIQYSVTVNNGTANPVAAEEGETVTITANAPEAGKVFAGWTSSDGVVFADASASITTFVMPAKNVTVTATYADEVVPTVLQSISLSGTYKTSFEVGDTFSYEGLVVTAHYNNKADEVVAGYTVSSPDMSTTGTKTVAVTYVEEEVTKTATYQITVTAKEQPPVDPEPETPSKGGLSGGAIAGIVIGSALVVGVGGFALVWFVIKKKTWADFLALFKKK